MLQFTQCVDRPGSPPDDIDSAVDQIETPELVETYCADSSTIGRFTAGANLVMLTNQIRFDSTEYMESSIKKESILTWQPINPHVSFRQTMKVQKTEIELQD